VDAVAPTAGGRKDSEATAVPSDSNDDTEHEKRKQNAHEGRKASKAVGSEDYFSKPTESKMKAIGEPERLDMAMPNGIATA
jgi:hypothetical protein